MKPNDLKVISGGTSGADLAGLWAALLFGIPTGGHFPKGSEPKLSDFFGLTESENVYHGRTLMNCEESDMTLVFASNIKSEGTKLTLHHCITNKIHCCVYCLGSDIDKSVESNLVRLKDDVTKHKKPITINVSGNSTATSPRAFTFTFLIMCRLFEDLLSFKPVVLQRYDVKKVEFMLRDCYSESTFDQLSNVEKSGN